MIRMRNIEKESMIGVFDYRCFVSKAREDNEPDPLVGNRMPIYFIGVHKIEILEIGVAIDEVITGGPIGAELATVGNQGYIGGGTIVATTTTASDAGSTNHWGLRRYDPPQVVMADYAAASDIMQVEGRKHLAGNIKLSFRHTGTPSVYTGWIFCRIRVFKIEDVE